MAEAVAEREPAIFKFSRPQWEAWNATERYLDLEGAYRSGKTTVALLKIGDLCYRHPGICCFIGRWTQDATDAQLKPRFLELCGSMVTNWIPEESCYELESANPETPSRVYVRGLKPSEGTSPFSKIHGLTLAVGYIDQPEEIPEEYFRHFQTRLSQPGYPQQLILSPNPPDKNHWIAREFPEDDSRRPEGYRYIRLTMRDNVGALGEEYVSRAERDLKATPAEYRRAILGERGVPMKGRPVYQGLFDASDHVKPITLNPAVPLIEIYDFGHRHPAVTWLQFPPGEMRILGGVMGQDLYIEDFVPYVEEIRKEWFPEVQDSMLWWTCDPAGDVANSHGTRSAVEILRGFGIMPRVQPDANTPPKRHFAIQTTGGYLRRRFPDGSPVFGMNRRFLLINERGERKADPVVLDAFSVGYVWDDDHAYGGTQYSNLRRPKKDGWYEHAMNTIEYGVLAFAPPDAAELSGHVRSKDAERRARQLLRVQGIDDAEEQDVAKLGKQILAARRADEQRKAEARALKLAQRDTDPADERRQTSRRSVWGGHAGRSRGGYR